MVFTGCSSKELLNKYLKKNQGIHIFITNLDLVFACRASGMLEWQLFCSSNAEAHF